MLVQLELVLLEVTLDSSESFSGLFINYDLSVSTLDSTLIKWPLFSRPSDVFPTSDVQIQVEKETKSVEVQTDFNSRFYIERSDKMAQDPNYKPYGWESEDDY